MQRFSYGGHDLSFYPTRVYYEVLYRGGGEETLLSSLPALRFTVEPLQFLSYANVPHVNRRRVICGHGMGNRTSM